MRDVRTKINDGGDPELNFLNRDYLRNNLQFSVFNLQLFSENQNEIKNGVDSENFFLKIEYFRSNL